MKSKIIFFLMIAIIGLINISCGKKFEEKLRDKHIVPYVPVYTEIDLNVGGESHFQISGQPLYQTVSRPTGKPLGYNGHGIIVIRFDDEYKCYDATCTNCEELTSYFTQQDLSGEIATCPVCHLQFTLRYGYAPESPKKIYPLREYPVSKRGNKLIISY